MKALSHLFLICAIAVWPTTYALSQTNVRGGAELESKVLTLKFKEGVTEKDATALEAAYRLKKLRQAITGFIDYEIALVRDIVALRDELKKSELVEAIQLNYVGQWYFQPNDPLVSQQWYLNNIQAFAAWDIARGNSEVVVAVLDTGIDWDHPDLASVIFNHPGEIPDNGIDDDGNGFVDDLRGWNFENDNKHTNDLPGSESFRGHGTRVSGIIGARLDNSIGIAGIAGGIRIMPIKVGGTGPLSSIIDDAILYAAQNGARIINMSFGWHIISGIAEDMPAIDAAILMARQQFGVLLVAASGDGSGSSSSNLSYPARNEHVIAVGGTEPDDTKFFNSHFGNDLDLAAPATGVISTNLGGGYSSSPAQTRGSSMSCAIVSGVAALILSKYPCLTPDQVKTCLIASADKTGGYNYNWNSGKPGHSWELGYGRVNTAAALNYVTNGLFPPTSSYQQISYNVNTTLAGIQQPAGHIIVNTGATLTITGELRLLADAYIIVRRGARLVVDGGTITRNLCFGRWGSIYVEGNSSLPQPQDPGAALDPSGPGVVWLRNGARIEYAHNAISLRHYPNYWNSAYWGGLVVAENTVFYNNRRSVEFMKYDLPNHSRFINCTFEGNPKETYAGVTIWSTDGILFERCSFSACGTGVLVWDTGCTIREGCTFSDMPAGVQSYATSPVSSGAAFRIGDAEGAENLFVNNLVHIEAYSTQIPKRLQIRNNRLLSGIYPPMGIFIDGPSQYIVQNNWFEDTETGFVAINTFGINNLVQCNDFSDGVFGVVASGANEGLRILENHFTTPFGDIILWEGQVPTSIASTQGQVNMPANNCFSANPEHIWTVGDCAPFNYFVPQGQEQTCKMPSTQSLVGNNNYFVFFTPQGDDPECPLVPPLPPQQEGPYTYNDYLSAKALLAYLENLLGGNPQNLQLRADVAAQNEYKHRIIDWFTAEALNSGSLENALSVLHSENSRTAKRQAYGLLAKRGLYARADSMLNAIPLTDQYDEQFYQIQKINLARLESEAGFELSTQQRETLKGIAYGKSPERGYARALLSLLEGYRFEPERFSMPDAAMQAAAPPALFHHTPEVAQPLVFPNPAGNALTLVIPGHWTGEGRLLIADLYGRQHLVKPWAEGQNIQLDLNGLPPGIYLLNVLQNGRSLFQQKVVKR